MDVIIAAAIIAFIAGIAGAATTSIVAYKIAVEQIHADTVTSERLRWHGDLRTTLSHFSAYLNALLLSKPDLLLPLGRKDLELYREVKFHLTRLRLLLYPSTASQQPVYAAVKKLTDDLTARDIPAVRRDDLALVEATQELLKTEWDDIQGKLFESRSLWARLRASQKSDNKESKV